MKRHFFLICDKCGYETSIKTTERWTTILCKCEIIIIYSTKQIKQISKDERKKKWV